MRLTIDVPDTQPASHFTPWKIIPLLDERITLEYVNMLAQTAHQRVTSIEQQLQVLDTTHMNNGISSYDLTDIIKVYPSIADQLDTYVLPTTRTQTGFKPITALLYDTAVANARKEIETLFAVHINHLPDTPESDQRPAIVEVMSALQAINANSGDVADQMGKWGEASLLAIWDSLRIVGYPVGDYAQPDKLMVKQFSSEEVQAFMAAELTKATTRLKELYTQEVSTLLGLRSYLDSIYQSTTRIPALLRLIPLWRNVLTSSGVD